MKSVNEFVQKEEVTFNLFSSGLLMCDNWFPIKQTSSLK